MLKAKLNAFAIHFLGSSLVISLYLCLVFLVWYPYPFYELEQVWDVIRIVVGVDLILGPLLTLIVFKPGKVSLKFDLSVIIGVQIAALLWGMTVTYQQRPVYVALVNDIFAIVTPSNINTAKLRDKSLATTTWRNPQLVYVNLPYDDAEYTVRGKENLKTGDSFAYYIEYYEPFAKHKERLFERAIDIRERMAIFPDIKRRVEQIVREQGGSVDDYVFMAIEGRSQFGILVIQRATSQVVDLIVE